MTAKTYEQLKAEIAEAYTTMPKQLRKIAHFAMEKPYGLALGTVASIAQASSVQPSSVIRFSNALGFGGFSEMQHIFLTHLVVQSSSYRERISRIRSRGGNGAKNSAGVLHQFVANASGELGHLEDNVHSADFKAAVKMLAGATQVFVVAQRRSFPVAYYLAYALSQLEIRSHLLGGLGGMLREFVPSMDRKEVLLAISFRNYSPDVIEVATACYKRRVPVIAITDTALSPLNPVSNICFEMGDDSTRPFRSLVGPLCLAQALVVSIGHQLATPAKRTMSTAKKKSK